MNYVFIAIFGLLIGSFLNAVIYRLKTKESLVNSRSKCPKCGRTLTWRELIPVVSFIIQLGRCKKCQKRISWQYPLVEIATAILFILAYTATSKIGVIPEFPWHNQDLFSFLNTTRLLVFISFFIIIFVYDLKHYLILDRISIPAIILAFFFNGLLQPSLPYLGNLLIAAVAVGGFFLIQFLVSRGKWIGGGDIRLGILMGAMLGWPTVLVALFIAYIIGSLVGIFLIAFGKHKLESQVPFGTFLVPGTIIALFWGEKILAWYLFR